MSEKVLVAMSGGVDSSVCAYLLKEQGHDCIGATMKLLDDYHRDEAGGKTCCSLEDVEDARAVAFRLGIPYYVFNFVEDFREGVMAPFAAAYERGETPNPCIECNRRLKFGKLYRRAQELGLSGIATGHYARITVRDGRFCLQKAVDRNKDQTYMLYCLTQEELGHSHFPLGDLRKEEVRAIAAEQGFVNARKRDSQDICFVPDGDYGAFLEKFTGKPSVPGDILDQAGKVAGQHKGAVRYTLGQRKGLGLAMGEPVYVCGKDMAANTVTVGPESALYTRECYAGEVNWVSIEGLKAPMAVTAKARYRQQEVPAVIEPQSDGTVRVVFDSPQRAVTPGQAVVWYQDDLVIGGGTILSL